jgi:hypothetical protein
VTFRGPYWLLPWVARRLDRYLIRIILFAIIIISERFRRGHCCRAHTRKEGVEGSRGSKNPENEKKSNRRVQYTRAVPDPGAYGSLSPPSCPLPLPVTSGSLVVPPSSRLCILSGVQSSGNESERRRPPSAALVTLLHSRYSEPPHLPAPSPFVHPPPSTPCLHATHQGFRQ